MYEISRNLIKISLKRKAWNINVNQLIQLSGTDKLGISFGFTFIKNTTLKSNLNLEDRYYSHINQYEFQLWKNKYNIICTENGKRSFIY